MKRLQTGFTMIELIIVIVILGILGAVALPKFIDMRTEAQQASVLGVAGAAGSAMTVNYSGCAVKNNVATAGKCTTINACSQVGGLMQGGVPSGYAVAASGPDIGAVNGNTATCTITADGQTGTFVGVSAGN